MMIHIMNTQNKSKLVEHVQPGDVQPNAVDLRVDKIFAIDYKPFTITEETKIHRGSKQIAPDANGDWTLSPGTYEVVMENVVEIGEGEAGWVITRSTLNRNGIFLTSGLYDSGYKGVMAGAMHVHGGPMIIRRGTRIGQFLLFKAESLKMYSGSYGIGTEHDKKYGVK